MLLLGATPRIQRIAAIQSAGDDAELLLHGGELPHRNGEKSISIEGDALVQLQFLLEPLPAEPERRLRTWRQVALEIVDIRLDRGRGFGRCVGEIAEDVEVIESGERPRQVVLDELEGAAPRLESDFDEDTRALFDVVARGLHEARHLPQL